MIKLSKLKQTLNNENNKTIISNAAGAFLVKGGALFVSLLTLPAFISYFNNQYILGLWFTILSVLTWMLTFDLGIGNGLRNHLVHAIVRKDDLMVKRYISSAYIVIGLVTITTFSISALIFELINWNAIFNISTDIISRNTLTITVFIVFSSMLIQLFLKLITSILYALQASALNNLLNLVTNVIILIYVTFKNPSDLTSSIISLAIVYGLAVNVPLLLTTIIVFSTKLKKSKPSIKYFGKEYAKDVLKLGGIFFWVQIMYMIITTTNEFLITWLTGTEMVVTYQIYNRLFTLVGTLFTLALTPVWSAVTKAFSEKNYIWIKKLYGVLIKFALIGIFIEFSLIFFLQPIVNFWLNDNAIQVNYFYAVIFAISGSVFIWNGMLSSIANGFGELRTQSIFFTIGAILKIPLAWFFVNTLDSWIGVVLADIIAMSLYCVIQPIWLKRYLNK